jgi:O-antigen ligase
VLAESDRQNDTCSLSCCAGYRSRCEMQQALRSNSKSSIVADCAQRRDAGTAPLQVLAVLIRILTERGGRRTLLAIAVLNISLQTGKHFWLREDDQGSYGGFELSLTNLALAGLYLGWLFQAAIRPRRSKTAGWTITLPAGTFLFITALSYVTAKDTYLWLSQTWNVFQLFLVYFYVAHTVTSRDVILIVRWMLIGLILQSMLMLAQGTGVLGEFRLLGLKAASSEFAGDNRPSGSFGAPNAAASYLCMTMAMALGTLSTTVWRTGRNLAIVGLAVGLPALLLTLSRGGWVAFAVSAIAILLSCGNRLPRIRIATFVAIGVMVAIPFLGTVEARLFGDDHGSATGRMPLNQLALTMIQDHPFSGVGANNFATAVDSYLAHGFPSDGWLYVVHNTYLLVAAETGVVGLAALLWLLFAIITQAKARWAAGDSWTGPVALGSMAAVVGLMVQMLFEPFRDGAPIQLLWLCAGLVAAMRNCSPLAASASLGSISSTSSLKSGRSSRGQRPHFGAASSYGARSVRIL